jgi:hypothetical protein
MDLLWRWRVLRTRRALLQAYGALLALTCVHHGLPWELAVVRERCVRVARLPVRA